MSSLTEGGLSPDEDPARTAIGRVVDDMLGVVSPARYPSIL